MSAFMRILPGLIAAVVALVALKLISVIGLAGLTAEIFVFVIAYIVVALAADKAMKGYGV